MQNQPNPKAPTPVSRLGRAIPRNMRLPLLIVGGIAACLALILIAINVLISADWVRDRVAARIKEEAGRDLKVNGSTTLLFMPSPRIVITDATFSDPEARMGTSDFSVAQLTVDLSLGELLSRQVDAHSVVLTRPVFTMRLGSEPVLEQRSDIPKSRNIKPKAEGDEARREIRLRDVRIEDGTVNLVDKDGKERRIDRIEASLSLPAMTDPFTGQGNLIWKQQSVNFSFELTTPADLRNKRPAQLQIALDTKAIAARFDGSMLTHPSFSGQGELSAKARSIPSLMAWLREGPAAEAAIGDGELASHLTWKKDEVSFSNTRFALQHANGIGEVVVTFTGPRPHIRAALALDHLDLNPFLASSAPRPEGTVGQAMSRRTGEASGSPETKAEKSGVNEPETAAEIAIAPPPSAKSAKPPRSVTQTDVAAPQAERAATPDEAQMSAAASQAEPAAPAAIAQTDIPASIPPPSPAPAKFDADINLNVRKTRFSHLDIGPSSVGLTFRDGILNATLGGMELYDGTARGKLTLDASKSTPAFTGDFRLDGVQTRPLLSDAAQFSLLSGRTKLEINIAGAGISSEEVKSSLQGQASVVVSDGAIEGMNITELISSVGAGNIPSLRQGPGAKTVFSDLSGSFTIANGIAETSNLQMQSPLLKIKAAGTVNLVEDSLDILTHPEIVAGPEGRGGANDLAGLRIPVRIEGPLRDPRIRPELGGLFADPETAGRTVNQIGEVLQNKLKGRPVGEALGRFLGNVQIGGEGGDAPIIRRRPPNTPEQQPTKQDESSEKEDPDLEEILR